MRNLQMIYIQEKRPLMQSDMLRKCDYLLDACAAERTDANGLKMPRS